MFALTGLIMDDRTKKARLVAKILRGPPYNIENMEEFKYFFGTLDPDMEFAACHAYYQLHENKIFTVKMGNKDGKGEKG